MQDSDEENFQAIIEFDAEVLSERLTNQCAEHLEISEARQFELLKKAIEGSVEFYLTEQLAPAIGKPAKEQKERLAELRDHLIRTANAFDRLTPEYLVALETRTKKKRDGTFVDVDKMPEELLCVAEGIQGFLEDFVPPRGRQPNLSLEIAVRTLLPAVENLAGERAQIRSDP